MKKIIFIPIIIIIILIVFYLFYPEHIYKTYTFHEYDIVVDLYVSKINKKIIQQLEDKINTYESLTDTSNASDNNLYTIRHNFSKEEWLNIDEELYNLLLYGKEIYQKSNKKIDMSNANINQLWKNYLESGIGIPSNEEITLSNNQTIDQIQLENGQIKNNHQNIDVTYFIKGYLLEEIKQILDKKVIKYVINFDNVAISKGYQTIKMGIENPDDTTQILKIIETKYSSISTTNYSKNKTVISDNVYHSIIDPNTLKPANYFKSVTVLSNDIKQADMISKTLFMMSLEDGQEYLKQFEDVEVIWYTLDDELIYN
jgi:thiamine biosynthesis lipoprotein